MVGASKILTVSYGTFSCTLEGFDDPFNTMKAIAEYFRDLAAEDRYFGAEPPTPDAAMLHKIAEREIQRRVEAKINENGVILRAEAGPAAPTRTDPVRIEMAPAAPVVIAPAPAAIAVDEPTVTEPVADTAAAPVVAESVAEKLMRIRSAVAQSKATEAAAPVATAAIDDAEYSEDQHAAEVVEDSPYAFDAFSADDAELNTVTNEISIPGAVWADEGSADLTAEPDAVADLPEQFDDILAATLAGLNDADLHEDVIATPQSDADFAESEAELDAAFADDDAQPPLEEDLADLAALDGAAPADVMAPLAPEEDSDDATLSSLIAGLGGSDAAPAADQPSMADHDLSAFDEDEAEELLADDADFADLVDELDDQAAAEDDLRVESDDAPENLDETVAEQDQPFIAEAFPEAAEEADEPAGEDASPVLGEKLQRARARVIKIRRNPAPAVSEADLLPPMPVVLTAPQDEIALSAEAEADLMRELAEDVDADDRAESAISAVVTTPTPDRSVRPVRPILPRRPRAGDRPISLPPAPTVEEPRTPLEGAREDAAVSRLIAQTNTEMAEPTQRRRLSAIAHLKAAVVATVAERRIGGNKEPSDEQRMDPYRDDLQRIVRPQNAQGTGTDRPAPLVLVSEQRIDRRATDVAPTRPAHVEPNRVVRPRRIAGASNLAMQDESLDDEDDLDEDENVFVDTKGFAEFAEKLGAQSLPDLLEAAAAYTATVEGRPHFSRPQLLRQAGMMAADSGFGREDSLRIFGGLLREGKITKVKRGQYALTDASHFLNEAKKLVG